MSILRKFLPQDNRSVEFISALSLIFMGLFCLGSFIFNIPFNMQYLIKTQNVHFWIALPLILGSLQLFSILSYPKTEILRLITAWANGSLWLWLSLSTSSFISTSDIAVFFLGVYNLYAFIVNALLLRKKWVI